MGSDSTVSKVCVVVVAAGDACFVYLEDVMTLTLCSKQLRFLSSWAQSHYSCHLDPSIYTCPPHSYYFLRHSIQVTLESGHRMENSALQKTEKGSALFLSPNANKQKCTGSLLVHQSFLETKIVLLFLTLFFF